MPEMSLPVLLSWKKDEIEFEEVEAFCRLGIQEGVYLDYKSEVNEIKKCVAAFSNTRGGIIIFGVEEDKKTGTPIKYEGIKENKDVERIYQQITHIDPLPKYRLIRSTLKNGKLFILLYVFEGEAPPYYVLDGKNNILVRTGSIGDPIDNASPEEVKRFFEKKHNAEMARNNNTQFSHEVYGGWAQRELRKQQIRAAQSEGKLGRPAELKTMSNMILEIQPYYPAGGLIEKDCLEEIVKKHPFKPRDWGVSFPDQNAKLVPIPKGVSTYEYADDSGWFQNYQLFSDGFFGGRIGVLWDNKVSLEYICKRAITALRFYGYFCKEIGYQGVVCGSIRIITPQGAIIEPWIDVWHSGEEVLLDSYGMTFQMDTNILGDLQLLEEREQLLIKDLHWGFGFNITKNEAQLQKLHKSCVISKINSDI